MSDDLIPPVPPAERVFKVPPPQPEVPSPEGDFGRGEGTSGQESKTHSGDVIKNQDSSAGKGPKGFFLGNFRQFLTKGIPFPWEKQGGAEPQALFASPVFKQVGNADLRSLLVNGIDLDLVNKVLTGVLVLLMVYSIIVAVNKESSIGRLMQSISHIRFEKSTSQAVEAYQPVDYYLGQVRGRDIFNPVGEVKTQGMPEPLPPPEPPKPKLKEMANGLNVVGIAWGEAPRAMIQDSATQEIYFLEKDDTIGKTGIKVKDIFRSKIVISYGEEEMEL